MKKTKKRILFEYLEAIVTALILALLIRAYLIQAFKIPTGSMIPSLLVGDHILVNRIIYGVKLPFSDKKVLVFKKPAKGDIIVFRYPEDPKRDFIKRVIAIEGDVIEARNKQIYVNGQMIKEPYVRYTDKSANPRGVDLRDNFGPFIVPADKYFVMGDNRDQSYDSRYWGYVDLKEIKGKAFIIYWSWDRERTMPRFNRLAHLVH